MRHVLQLLLLAWSCSRPQCEAYTDMRHILAQDYVNIVLKAALSCAGMQLMHSSMKALPKGRSPVHRDVVAPTLQAVADAAEALRSKGFVNYFGLQRFGAGVNATHQ